MIVFGTRLFGWVDEIEGAGIVATRFFHVMWIPLIPMGSVFMVDDERGASISLSLKSIVVAWVRSFCFWGAAASLFGIPATFGVTCLTFVPLAVGYFVVPLFTRKASEARAAEILAGLGR